MATVTDNERSLADRLRKVRVSARHDLHVSRQSIHGKAVYILHDPVRFASHQLESSDYQVLTSLSADRTLNDTFKGLVQRRILSADQEPSFYQFIVYLNQLGLLTLSISDGRSLYDRHEELREAKARARLNPMNLLFVRVPLVKPDIFLASTVRLVSPLFSRAAFGIWCCGLLVCAAMIGIRWNEFADPLDAIVMQANLPVLWSLLFVLKIIHEFGHAYACKHFGGHVPEMGAFFMVFAPCAYVDASSAWTFPSRRQRIIVSLGGMYFESIVAMLTLLTWCFTEPSPTRAVLHQVFVLSSIITLGFNLNPLMRYDGYYVLADLVSMPNLRAKSSAVLTNSLKRLFFGTGRQDATLSARAIRWLLLFGIASAVYRVVVIVGIVTLLAIRFPTVGMLAGGVLIGGTVWRAARKLISYVTFSPEMESRRMKSYLKVAACAMVGLLVLGVIPLPSRTRAVGIVERSNDIVVYAKSSGFLLDAPCQDGQQIAQGGVICTLKNHDLEAQVEQQAAQVNRLQASELLAVSIDHDATEALDQQRVYAVRLLADLQQKQANLQIKCPIEGQVAELVPFSETGRYVREGEEVARITDGRWLLRVAMTEDAFGQAKVKLGTVVNVRLSGTDVRNWSGRVHSVSKVASDVVPDVRLTQIAGGPIPVHPTTLQAQAAYVEIKIELDDRLPQDVLHGMSGIALVPCHSERIASGIYRRVIRFFHRAKLDS